MSVANRQYELEAGTGRQLQLAEPFTPQTIDEAIQFTGAACLAEVVAYDGDQTLQDELVKDIAIMLYEKGCNFAAHLAIYEARHGELEEDEATSMLHAAQRQRGQNPQTAGRLAISQLTLPTGEKRLKLVDKPPQQIPA